MKKLDELNDSIDIFNAIVENMKWFDRVQQIVVDLVDQSKEVGEAIKREHEVFRKENDSLGGYKTSKIKFSYYGKGSKIISRNVVQ